MKRNKHKLHQRYREGGLAEEDVKAAGKLAMKWGASSLKIVKPDSVSILRNLHPDKGDK